MNDERWYNLVDRIGDQFGISHQEELPLERGPGKLEVVEFNGPGGRMRLERVTRPVVTEHRTHYSKRAGAGSTDEFKYSEDEFTHRVSFFRWVGGDWQEEDFRGVWQ